MYSLLSNCQIIDVKSGKIRSEKYIVIKDSKIFKILEDRPQTSDITEIDVGGKFVLPGFIDAHVHVNAIAANLNNLRFQPATYVVPQAIKIMKEMLLRGFTTVRDAAGADWGIARAVEEGYIISPRIIFGGQALSSTGGHGDSRSEGDYSGPYPRGSELSILCNGVSEVRKACRDLIRTGAHHIKIMASGGVASPTDRIDSLQFSEDEIRAIVEEANNANIYVLAHTYTAKAVNRAIKLGVRSIEHANLLDEESISLFKEYDAFLVPTLVTYYALKEEGMELGLPPESYRKIDSVLETGKRAIRMAYEGGVKMAYGTDLLGDMQRRQLEEFALLYEIMPPLDSLKTATINSAQLLKMEDKIGDILEGGYADLLVYSENPLRKFDILQNPEQNLLLIMKDGQIYKNII